MIQEFIKNVYERQVQAIQPEAKQQIRFILSHQKKSIVQLIEFCNKISGLDKNDQLKWSTIGVSHNVIDASYIALNDSITYHLLKSK